MITESILPLGKFIKTFAYKGQLVLMSNAKVKSLFFQTELVFVIIDGLPVPFFIDENGIQPKNENYLIKLKDINTDETAVKLVGKEVYVNENLIQNEAAGTTGFQEFELFNQDDKYIGKVEQIVHYSQNTLLQLTKHNREILVPFTENHILEIDNSAKKIKMKIPDGLIELFEEDK